MSTPSSRRAESFAAGATRSWSSRVFAANGSASASVCVSAIRSAPSRSTSTVTVIASSTDRLTRKTAVGPVSASCVATASTSGTSPYAAVA